MTKWDAECRILNHLHTRRWRDIPQDEADPDFHPDIIPCDKFCPIGFGRKIFVIFPGQDCFLTDIRFWDDPLARPFFSAKQIADTANKFRQTPHAHPGDSHWMLTEAQPIDSAIMASPKFTEGTKANRKFRKGKEIH